MNKNKPTIRDLLAFPFMLLGLFTFWIAGLIGGKWTNYEIIQLFKNK